MTEVVREVVAGLKPLAIRFEGVGVLGPNGDAPFS